MENQPSTIRKLYLDEVCLPSLTVHQRLQIFLKKASSWASSRNDPVLYVYNLGEGHVCCSCCQFFFPVFFFLTMFAFFFFSTYLWSARQDFSHASSAHCHQEISDLKIMFRNNMDLESKKKFPFGYYNWMLILIHLNPRRLVFLVFLVQTIAYPIQTPEGGGGVFDQYLGISELSFNPSDYKVSFRRPDVCMNLIKHLKSICLLMKQRSRVGIPLERWLVYL